METQYEALSDDFLAAHIPTAVFIDWTKDIVDVADSSAPVQLASHDAFARVMEAKGISTAKTVCECACACLCVLEMGWVGCVGGGV